MVLNLKVNVALEDSVALQVESDVTWNGFLNELEREFAVPRDLLKIYNISDHDRLYNCQCYVTDSDKEKKLIELTGLEQDGQYEFDLELPHANNNDLTKIKVNSGRCTIISKKKLIELDNPRKEYKIKLDNTGFRSKTKGKKLKVVTNSSEEGHKFKKYIVEDVPNSRIEIGMKDMENPVVELFDLGNRRSIKSVDFEDIDIMLHGAEPLAGTAVKEAAMGILTNMFTYV